MRKILKVAGIALAVLIVIGLLTGRGGDKNSSVKEAFKEGQEKGEEVVEQIADEKFTKEDALKKIQDCKITVDLKSPNIPKGTTIFEVYEIKGEVPAIKNLGWFSEETDEEGKYIVGYKQTVSDDLLQEPRWEVTENSIKALNGKAIAITPEFGPKE